jgi:hypothetical protein
MKAATINELKQELTNNNPAELLALCLRLARFKKENKELLTYLLFQEHNTPAYIESIKQEVTIQFSEINKSNVYFIKKSLRKILRTINKYIRYSGLAVVEIESLIFFCTNMKELPVDINNNTVLSNIYLNQLKKINKASLTLHEDLQYDYQQTISEL